ncbi:MAG: hypothetical protein JSV62_01430, partial [Promethearchaeota archaeon]
VEKSKYFLELIKEQAPNAQSAVIGNKQDLKEAMNSVQIENVLGLKAYSMIALDPNNRDKMIQIIADVLEMSAEVSPLLKPLLERDKLTEEAVKALKNADFNKAAFLFDKISDLCVELGDDSLGKEFFEKSQKIKEMLKKVGAPPPVPATLIEPDEQKIPEPRIKSEKVQSLPVQKPEIQRTPPPPILPPQQLPERTPQETTQQPLSTPSEPTRIDIPQDISSIKTKKDLILTKETDIKAEVPSLKLKPEDFMIRARPKSVEFVPDDAKSKLTISPQNQVKIVEEAKAPVAVSPLKLMEEKAKSSIEKPKIPLSPKPTLEPVIKEAPQHPPEKPIIATKPTLEPVFREIPQKPSEKPIYAPSSEIKKTPTIMTYQQKEKLKQSLLDLKIKKAHLTKMALDFDMQELKGEISSEELKDKKEKVKIMMDKIDNQIYEIEVLLGD